MKKIKYILIILIMMLPVYVKADHIYSIDMDIHIEKDGTANITEVWDVKADSGSEWYKTMYDLGESKISDFRLIENVGVWFSEQFNTEYSLLISLKTLSIKYIGAFFSFAIFLNTSFTDSGCLATITGVFSFIIPAFSVAIFSNVFPKNSVCSNSIVLIQQSSGFIIFVASSRPPNPTSNIP